MNYQTQTGTQKNQINNNIINQQAEEISNFFINYRDSFETDLHQFPDSVIKIKDQFTQFQNEQSESIYIILKQKYKLEDISQEDVKLFMQSEILEPLISQMEAKIDNDLWQNTLELLKVINIEQQIQNDQFFNLLDNKKLTIDENFPKFLISMQQIIFVSPSCYNKGSPDQHDNILRAKVINNFLDDLYICILKIFEKVFKRYEINDIFENQLQSLMDRLCQLLEKTYKEKQKSVYQDFQQLLQQNLTQVKKQSQEEIKANMEIIPNNKNQVNLANILRFSKEFKKIYKELYTKSIKQMLNYVPHEMFLKSYYLQIDDIIDKEVNSYLYKIKINQDNLNNFIKPLLQKQLFELLRNNFQNLYSYSKDILDNLFSIICCSMHHFRFREEINDFKEILVNLNKKYFSKSISEKSRVILQYFCQTFDDYVIKQTEIKQRLQETTHFWQSNISEELNLMVIQSLYIEFSQISMENDKIIVAKQNPLWRYFLKEILKNLNNGNYSYFNWQIVNLLDEMIEEQLIYKYSTTKKDLIQFQLENCNYDAIQELRTNQNDHTKLETLQHNILTKIKKEKQLNYDIPEKFLIHKISDPEKISRMINICISGFLSEDEDKQMKWQNLVKEFPNQEFYSLDYKSKQTQQIIFQMQDVFQNYKELTGIISSKALRLGGIGFFLVNTYLDNPFVQAYNQAELCGKYLAHILADQILFPNCSINLVGFSLGTKIIQSCLEELHTMEKANVINEVLMMGGVADVYKIQKLYRINSISGSLINTYSRNDYILKYLYKLVKYNITSVGLYSIQKNEKIVNHDLSNIINGHLKYLQHINEIINITNFNNFNNDINL